MEYREFLKSPSLSFVYARTKTKKKYIYFYKEEMERLENREIKGNIKQKTFYHNIPRLMKK